MCACSTARTEALKLKENGTISLLKGFFSSFELRAWIETHPVLLKLTREARVRGRGNER